MGVGLRINARVAKLIACSYYVYDSGKDGGFFAPQEKFNFSSSMFGLSLREVQLGAKKKKKAKCKTKNNKIVLVH